MSISTHELTGRFPYPVLVSELPPVRTLRPSLRDRVRDRLAQRRLERDFEDALRAAGPAQQSDLIALARRS
jgi:hypothetical protein